eukprot:265001_1
MCKVEKLMIQCYRMTILINPKKEEDDDEKEDLDHDSSDSSENDESVPISKVYELASLDVLVTKEETEKKDAIADLFDRKEDELPTDEMLEDPCYRHLIEELGRAGLQATDNKNIAKPVPKSIILKKIKKATKLTYVIGSRVFSLFDIVTDALLLYTSSLNDDLWFFTLGLVISMSAPYIMSYSSGVQLYLFRQSFDESEGFGKIVLFSFLLPTGVLYFVILDLVDILLHLFRWCYFVVCCRSSQEMGQTEQKLSEQLGMDRMNWEGFKRQRSIGQLMFESVPQVILQTILFSMSGNAIAPRQLIISIAFATINIMASLFKLNLEAKCCRCSFISYALICIKARVGWVPQRERILEANYGSKDVVIDYDMSHKPALFCGLYKHSIEYDFSQITVQFLMTALQTITLNDKTVTLRIDFGNTLRLLPLQDVIDLYMLCQEKAVIVTFPGSDSQNDYDWSSAIETSAEYGKDARIIKHARDAQGAPYIMTLVSLTHYSHRG